MFWWRQGKSMGHKIIAMSNGGDDVAELMGYDTWPQDISHAFDHALGVTAVKYLKNRENRTFAFNEVIADYRTLEADYVAQLGTDTENALQVRRIIAEKLIFMAWALEQPFETCQQYWHELQQLGFYRIERKINETFFFADICREHGRTDLSLEVLAPVIAEVERLRAEPNLTQWATEFYEQELESLRKLRARLEAERT
jgi:hypothetical protein